MVVTKCYILRLKCTKIDFGCVSSKTPLAKLAALHRPPNWNKGDLLLRERKGCREGGDRKGKRKEEREGRGREVRGEREGKGEHAFVIYVYV